MGTGKMNQGRRILFIILPLIVLASLSLWYLRNFYRTEFVQMTRVEPENGVYDLTGMDFSDGFVRLQVIKSSDIIKDSMPHNNSFYVILFQ